MRDYRWCVSRPFLPDDQRLVNFVHKDRPAIVEGFRELPAERRRRVLARLRTALARLVREEQARAKR